jgi:hypothetical protein
MDVATRGSRYEPRELATLLWHTQRVTGTGASAQLRAATARRKRSEGRLRDARSAESRAIRAALDSGIRQVEIVAITGYTREHVRRLAAAAEPVPHAS